MKCNTYSCSSHDNSYSFLNKKKKKQQNKINFVPLRNIYIIMYAYTYNSYTCADLYFTYTKYHHCVVQFSTFIALHFG